MDLRNSSLLRLASAWIAGLATVAGFVWLGRAQAPRDRQAIETEFEAVARMHRLTVSQPRSGELRGFVIAGAVPPGFRERLSRLKARQRARDTALLTAIVLIPVGLLVLTGAWGWAHHDRPQRP